MLSRRSVLVGTAADAVGVTAIGTSSASAAMADTDAVSAADTTTETIAADTVLPGGARYAELVVGHNTRWIGTPESVRVVHNTSQVIQVVQEAVKAGKRIAVRGGGFGLLSRQFDLTVDHLYAVEVIVVNANGKARKVFASREDNDPNRELWWAHTGSGGNNFGVVARYYFRTPGATGDWHERNSNVGSAAHGLTSLLVMNHKSNGNIGIITQVDASVPGADTMIQDYLAEITSPTGVETKPLAKAVGEQGPLPAFFTPRKLPWLTSVRLLGTNNPALTNPTLCSANKSAYHHKGLTTAQAGSLYNHLTRTDFTNPMSNVMLFGYGSKINTLAARRVHRGVLRERRLPGAQRHHRRLLRQLPGREHHRPGAEPARGRLATL